MNYLNLNEITTLHMEHTSKCNLLCPQCARVDEGKLNPKLPLEELTLDDYKRILTPEFAKQIKRIFWCGNYGDSIASNTFLECLEFIRHSGVDGLTIVTNGSARNPEWWTKVAHILDRETDRVDFSVDGLEDTNHIYRVNVDWNKLERNFMAFIEEGGTATWKWLIFEHNKHQTKEASQVAKFYGFSRFDARMSMRDPPDLYQTYIKQSGDKETDFTIQEAQDLRAKEIDTVANTEDINCKSLAHNRIYLNGEGRIWPCCYTSQHYCKSHAGYPEAFEKSNPYLFNHYNKGFNLADKHSLQFILQHAVWDDVKEEWGNKNNCEYKVCWKRNQRYIAS